MNEVVIGSTLEALLFAYLNNLKIYFNVLEQPYWWLETPINLDLDRHYLPYFNDLTIFYNYLYSILSLSGKIPFGESKIIKIIDDKLLIDNEEIKYDKIYVFTEENIEGLPTLRESSNIRFVTDFFNVRYGANNDNGGWFKTEGKLANTFLLYRLYRLKGLKCVAMSKLTDDELKLEDYSLDSTRFKLYYYCVENNIHGGYMNSLNNKINYHRLEFMPKIRHKENLEKLIFDSSDRIICATNWKLEEILSQDLKFSYSSELSNRFKKHNEIYY